MILQTDVDNATAREIAAAGLDLDATIRTLLETAAVGLQRPGCWEREWVRLALGEECFTQAPKRKAAEKVPAGLLVTCPACATPNFTLRGLRAHRCAARLGLQLTEAEVKTAVAMPKRGAQ